MRHTFGFLLVLSLLTSSTALAQDDPEARARAREHFIAGSKLFDLGKYDEAIREYELAYKDKDDPVLLYDLGQAHRLANHPAEAIRFYKVFLAKVGPRARNRPEVENKIRELEKLLAQTRRSTGGLPPDGPIPVREDPPRGNRAATSTEPRRTEPVRTTTEPVKTTTEPVKAVEPPPKKTEPMKTAEPPPKKKTVESPPPKKKEVVVQEPPPKKEEPPATVATSHPGRTKKIAGLVVAVAGVAMVGVGVGMGVVAMGASSDVTRAAMNHMTFEPAKEATGNMAVAVEVAMLVVGGVAVAAGVVLFVVGQLEGKRAPREQARTRFLPAISPTSVGATLEVRF